MTGPGGAGTTTLAAGAAVRAARSGQRVVLLTRQSPPVPGLDAVPGLDVRRRGPAVGRRAALGHDGRRRRRRPPAARRCRRPAPSSRCPVPPSSRCSRSSRSADADLVVVDAGPLELAAALVAPAVVAALVAGPAHAAGRARAGRRPHGGGRLRRRANGDRWTPPSPPSPSWRGCSPATGWPTRRQVTVCLVAPAAGSRRCRPCARRPRRWGCTACAPAPCSARVLPLDGPGAWAAARGAEQDERARPRSPRWRRCTASPRWPSRRTTSRGWPACSTASTCPPRRAPRRRRPSGMPGPGSSPCRCPSPSAPPCD